MISGRLGKEIQPIKQHICGTDSFPVAAEAIAGYEHNVAQLNCTLLYKVSYYVHIHLFIETTR